MGQKKTILYKKIGNNLTKQTELNYSEPSNPNLLDNWYFVNPINQRGKTEYTEDGGYTIDRWRRTCVGLCGHSLSGVRVTENGLQCMNDSDYYTRIEQFFSDEVIKFINKKTITISALFSTGKLISATGVYDKSIDPFEGRLIYNELGGDNNQIVEFYVGLYAWSGYGGNRAQVGVSWSDQSIYCVAAKLEIGNKQTLAKKDSNGKYILSDSPPNYATELQKCQRYFQVLGEGTIGSVRDSGTTIRLHGPLVTEMRTTPTLIVNNTHPVFSTLCDGLATNNGITLLDTNITSKGIVWIWFTHDCLSTNSPGTLSADTVANTTLTLMSDDAFYLSADFC